MTGLLEFSSHGSESSSSLTEFGVRAKKAQPRARLLALMDQARVSAANSDTHAKPDDQTHSGEPSDEVLARRHPPPLTSLERWIPKKFLLSKVDPGRKGFLALAAAALLAAVVMAVVVWFDRPVVEEPLALPVPPPLPAVASPVVRVGQQASAPPREELLVVSVVGRVSRPGLVHVAAGSRVAHALDAAGGPLPGTDITSLNLARRLADGEQLYVGIPTPAVASDAGSPSQRGGAADSDGTGSAGGGRDKLDLNAATAEQLDSLPGVGPVMAERIVRWRTENGRFTSVDQLRNVPGIGEAKFSRLRDAVRT